VIRSLTADSTTVLLTSHYMDEVEALAQTVAVLSKGSVVASGSPAGLGGRDRGAATVRFTLPEGLDPGRLPVPPDQINGRRVEYCRDDEVRLLQRLTNWAVDGGLDLEGLTVARLTLEDIYLELTAAHCTDDDAGSGR
jgi:ABC-2 type transport system ATP-binding protein